MKISVKSKVFWLAVTGITLIIAGGGLLLAQKPKVVRSFAFDQEHSYLGIMMENVTAENMAEYKLSAERGVIVRSVEKGSPAETAGIKEKDIILEYAGTQVISTMQLARLVQETPPGRRVTLAVSRDGKGTTLTAKIDKKEGVERFGGGRMIVPGPDSEPEFSFDGPAGKFFQFRGGPGAGPFSFALPGDRGSIEGKPRLGITLQNLTYQLAEHMGVPGKKGVLVAEVTEGSPAATANLRAGDVIIKADGRGIEEPDDLTSAVRQRQPGDKLELKVIRDRKEITLTVELPKETRKSGGYRL
jgi:S1-C subfamily serine protease